MRVRTALSRGMTPSSRPRSARTQRRHPWFILERLEDRTLLAVQDLGPLRFSANAFSVNGGQVTANGTIELGLVPTQTEAFRSLIEIDGSLSFANTTTNQTFTVTGATVSSIVSGSKVTLLAGASRDFAVADLVGGGSSLSTSQVFPVAGLGFSPDLLKLDNPGGGSTADARVALQGDLAVADLLGLGLAVAGTNFVFIDGTGVSLTGASAGGTQFDAFGLTVMTSGLSVAFSNVGGVETFGITGSVSVSDDDVSFTGSLGDATTPGLVIGGGVVQRVDISVSGSIAVADLSIVANALTYSYDATSALYEVAGMASLSVSGTIITADLGTADTPGLTFQGGLIQQVVVGLSGSFTLFSLELKIDPSNPLRLQFQRGSGIKPDSYIITGAVSAPELFDASVALGGTGGDGKPQPGIEIVGGAFKVDSLTLAMSGVPLGAFTVQKLVVSYHKTSTGVDFAATLDLLFPEGWAVGGTIAFVNGKVEEIGVTLNLGDTPIPIGDTGLFLEAMSADVKNIEQPENLVVSGSLTVVLGDQVEIFGESVYLARATGAFTVDKNELILDAEVALAAATDSQGKTTALLGEGTGRVTLDWGAQTYVIDVSASLLDGVFTIDAGFAFDGRGDVTISAEADVNFPDGIPFIGGKRIGSLDFLFEYRPPVTPGGKAVGFVAAWLELDIFFKFDVGIEYNFEDRNSFSLIGAKGVDAAKAGACNPAPQTYIYVSSFTVPEGATIGTLSVDWPTAGGTQTVAVKPGTQQAIAQGQFSSANGLSLIPRLADTSSFLVNVVGSSADPTIPLPVGEYQLILTSNTKYATPPKFTGAFSYPKPTIHVGALPPMPGSGSITIPLSGTVDRAFGAVTTASIYLDTNGSGYDGTLIARDILFNPNGFSAPFNLNGLLPLPYYVYAIINDGTNTPVNSAYSNAVTPTPPLTGTVENLNNNQGISGWTVYLDANGNGVFDPATDPSTTTGATGFYAFYTPQLPVNQAINVGLVVPRGFEFITGAGSHNPTTITYNGVNAVIANFNARQLAAISGTVYDDVNANGGREPGEAGLSGWTLYLDANGNGRLDAGETTATSNNSGNYVFLGLDANTSYTVGLLSRLIGRQTGPKPVPPGTFTATIGVDPYQQVVGQDFGVQLLGAVGGTVSGHKLNGGRLDPNAGPLAGWTVQLRDAMGNIVATTTSGADGSYLFGEVTPGNYTVTEVVPAGWRQISPSQTNVTFTSIATTGVEGKPVRATTADFDGDGHLDVALISFEGSFTVLFGAGDGTFPVKVTYSQPGGGDSPIVALDANGDGRPDLAIGRMILDGFVTVNSAIDLFLNTGGGDRTTLFGLASSLRLADIGTPSNGGLLDLARGDFNKDGRDDLIAAIDLNSTGTNVQPYYATLLSLGTSFTLSSFIDAPQGSLVAIGDLNNDGNLDFVNALTGSGPLGFSVHYGDGTGDFPTQVTVGQGHPGGRPAGILALGDINGDGLLDVALGDFQGENIAYSLQNGAGTFATPLTVKAVDGGSTYVDSLPPRILLKDFNGDLRPDLATVQTSISYLVRKATLNLFLNPGTAPAFQDDGLMAIDLNAPTSFQIVTSGLAELLLAADVNGDGLLDVIILPNAEGFLTMLNTTSPTPGIAVKVVNVGQVTAGNDFDNAQLGQVSGLVFEDVNRNGRREAGEGGTASQVVYLDLNRNGALDPGEPTATTVSDGAYAFAGLPDGLYLVRPLVPASRRVTTSDSLGFEVRVLGGSLVAGGDIGVADRLLSPIADQTASEFQTIRADATLTAAAAGPLRFRLGPGAPVGVRIDPLTGVLTWTPGGGQGPGTYPVTVIVDDAFTTAPGESTTFHIEVAPASETVRYVASLYQTILGRGPDPDGLAFWAGLIDLGVSRHVVANEFWRSPEHRGLQVDGYYATYLQREADPEGRAFWVHVLLAGVGEEEVVQGFLNSTEYRSLHPVTPAPIPNNNGPAAVPRHLVLTRGPSGRFARRFATAGPLPFLRAVSGINAAGTFGDSPSAFWSRPLTRFRTRG